MSTWLEIVIGVGLAIALGVFALRMLRDSGINNPIKLGPGDMGPIEGHAFAIGFYTIFAAMFAGAGVLLSYMTGVPILLSVPSLLLSWTFIFFGICIKVQKKNTFMVVERAGKFWMIKFAGWRIVIPGLDEVYIEDSFFGRSTNLYSDNADGSKTQIDFKDDSAPADISAWWQPGNPIDIDANNVDELRKQIKLYAYRFPKNEREKRVAEAFEGALRPNLQQRTIDEAQTQSEEASEAGVKNALPALNAMGVWPSPVRGIIIHDIELSQETTLIRRQRLDALAKASAEEALGTGYAGVMVSVKKALQTQAGAQPIAFTDKEIMTYVLNMEGLKTIREVKPNMTLVSRDLGNATQTIMVNSSGGS